MKKDYILEREKCLIIQSQIEILNHFYRVIGDDYDPAEISFQFDLSKRIDPNKIFVYKSVNNIGSNKFYEENIKSTKEEINNPIQRLKELADWNRNHVISYGGSKIIQEQKFRLAEFREIYDKIIEKIKLLTLNWEITSQQYLIDSRDS